MNAYLIVAISSAVACVVLATVAAVVNLDNDSDQKTALKFCLPCIVLALLGAIFFGLSERHIEKQNELTRRDYKGVVYYKYKRHVTRKHSCTTYSRIIIKLFNGKKVHIKNVDYVTFSKLNNGDTISFNLTDEDVIKNQE
jgi:hypothetical protein